jgi:hypothetical protein
MIKTLIGKNGFLFLKNDSNKELEIHCNNLDNTSIEHINKYKQYNDKLMLIIYPDKSFVCKEYLPHKYNAQFRPGYLKYKENLSEIYDMYPYIKDISVFSKTDTHFNILGCYIVYKKFIELFNIKFNKNLIPIELELTSDTCIDNKCLCDGDLTESINRGNLQLACSSETIFKTTNYDLDFIYTYIITTHNNFKILDYSLNDVTSKFIGQTLSWNILTNYIIFYHNENSETDYTSIIFHDSFLVKPYKLYINSLSNTFLIKNNFNTQIIDLIKPDYILEFRIERFLL